MYFYNIAPPQFDHPVFRCPPTYIFPSLHLHLLAVLSATRPSHRSRPPLTYVCHTCFYSYHDLLNPLYSSIRIKKSTTRRRFIWIYTQVLEKIQQYCP